MYIQYTYNKLRTEQSTDFKLYIGSDEPFAMFAQHVHKYVQCTYTYTYNLKYCSGSRTTTARNSPSLLNQKHNQKHNLILFIHRYPIYNILTTVTFAYIDIGI